MKKVFKITDKVCEIIAWFGVLLTVVMAVMYFIDVIGRLVFHSQFKGTFEIAQFLLCLIVFISYPYAQVKRGHIHVGIVMHHLPTKLKHIILSFGFLWCAATGAFVTYALWTQGQFTQSANKITQVLDIPYFPIYYASSVLMGVFTITIIFDFIRSVMAIAGDTECQESIEKVLS